MSTILKIAGGIVLGGLVLVVGCGLLLTGSDTETINEPTEESQPESEATPDEPAAEQKTASVGDTLTLEGFEGLRMDVTLESVDKVTGGEFDQPAEGTEYVGVNLRMKNVSEQTYNDSPSNGATLITQDDEQITSTILMDDQCSGGDAARIAPGDSRSMCIPYEVPTDTELRLFQFALESGFSEQAGEWKLDGGSSGG